MSSEADQSRERLVQRLQHAGHTEEAARELAAGLSLDRFTTDGAVDVQAALGYINGATGIPDRRRSFGAGLRDRDRIASPRAPGKDEAVRRFGTAEERAAHAEAERKLAARQLPTSVPDARPRPPGVVGGAGRAEAERRYGSRK